MKFFLLIIVHFLGTLAHANDCQVSGILPNLVMLHCKDRTDQQNFYTVDGKVFEMVKEANGSIFAEGDTTNLKEGDVFTYSLLNQTQYSTAVQPGRVQTKAYFVGLSYKKLESEMESDAIEMKKGDDLNVDFELKNEGEETRVAPTTLLVEFNIEKSWGILVSPDFENNSGELSIYKKLGEYDLGGFVEHGRDRKSTKLKISGKDLNGTVIKGSGYEDQITTVAGFLGRYLASKEGHEVLSTIKLGYAHSANNDEDQVLEITSGLIEVTSSIYFRMSQSFLMGFGGRYATSFNGQFKMQNDTFEVVKDAKVTEISLYPLLAQFTF